MTSRPIPLHDRERDYAEAEEHADAASARWLEARAAGRLTPELEAATDEAQREFIRAKRRLERAQRRERVSA